MQLLQWLPIFVFGLLASAEQQQQQQQSTPKELEIKTTYTPSDCSVKAQKGDPIKVHYVRFFLRIVLYCGVDVTKPLPSTDRDAILQWRSIRLEVCMMLFACFSPSLNTCVTVCCSHGRGQPFPLTRAPSLSESSFTPSFFK